MRIIRTALAALAIILVAFGCSQGGSSPINSDIPAESSLDSIPIIAYDSISATSMFGAYNLSISPGNASAELTPMRISSLGEAFIVSGKDFFANKKCLRIKSIAMDEGTRIILTFEIKHPFEKGDPVDPPSKQNRLDLDIFDLTMVIRPHDTTPRDFQLADVYSGIILNADGYTTELGNVIGDNAALPCLICHESSNNNRFEMGTDWQEFDVLFNIDGQLEFDIFLTMGYGISATWEHRLYPEYYVPEFNKKAAWKIDVFVSTWWAEGDTTSAKPVIIDIYDWNHGAPVSPIFPDPEHPDQLSASSDIASVTVEVPGMFDSTVDAATVDTNYNGWDNPASYKANLINENNLPKGSYPGLVKVTDSRIPASLPEETDLLVHYPDGIESGYSFSTIPEFATYQVFHVTIEGADNLDFSWGYDWGSFGADVGYDIETDSEGNVYVTGCFSGTVDFDPSDGEEFHTSNGETDIFLSKFNVDGEFQWTKAWGGSIWDEGHGIAFDIDNNIFVTGYFRDEIDLNPGAGQDLFTSMGETDAFLCKFNPYGTYLWGTVWGGAGEDQGRGVALIDTESTIYVTGFFEEEVDFDPGPSTDTRNVVGDKDAYVVMFFTDFSYRGALVWGSTSNDRCYDIASIEFSYFVVTGIFNGTVDFDPGASHVNRISNGGKDIFVTMFSYPGNWVWTATWGGTGADGYPSLDYTSGNIYVTGYFEDTVDFDTGVTNDFHTSNGGRDIFLNKINLLGTWQWARTWGGMSIWDEGHGVSVTSLGDIYITGSFADTVDFDTSGSEDLHTSNGGRDIFLSKFDNDGDWQWAETWGGMGIWDEGHGVAAGSCYITGSFEDSVDFNPNPGGEDWHYAHSGSTDVFLIDMRARGYSESEPNDACDDANNCIYNIIHNGSVREAVDNEDFWVFEGQGILLDHYINLYNESGYDIDLYIYTNDCLEELSASTNVGGSDEIIGPLNIFEVGQSYKIKVVNKPDGYSGEKDYSLQFVIF